MITDLEKVNQLIYEAISTSFEGLAFMELTPDQSMVTGDLMAEHWLWSRLNILAPCQGEFALICPDDVCSEIASAIFGSAGEDLAETFIVDTLGEIANTAAGSFLGSYLPADHVFSLGLPKDGKGWPDNSNALFFGFKTIEERPIFVMLRCKA